ncbi:MAG TPA: hypothetical protein VJR89_02550 [Polyangiales bacterium]|nr:hypothetical protein [Polyangiales bacterium]
MLLIGYVCAACGHQVPDHDVVVTSDCRGETETARYHFDAMDFETSCSGGLLTGECNTNSGTGRLLSGDIGAVDFFLTGLEEFGPSRYETSIVPAGHSADEYKVFDPNHRLIWCGWYVDENLNQTEDGDERSCYYADCSAEIEVIL